MSILISFLRGVNMAGHNKIRMTDLISMFGKCGFNDAESYIQSGNIIFTIEDKMPVKKVTSKIETAIKQKFKFDIPVMVRTTAEIKKIIASNPFADETGLDPSKLAVIFLHEAPAEAQIDKVRHLSYPPDKFMIAGSEIYIYCPNGFGRTKIYTNFFENKMKVVGTGRNWKTINTILDIAGEK